MVGLMQIMIYLFCIYLVYKGFEIFQIAFVTQTSRYRNAGIIIGALAIICAIAIGGVAVFLTETMVADIGNKMNSNPLMK